MILMAQLRRNKKHKLKKASNIDRPPFMSLDVLAVSRPTDQYILADMLRVFAYENRNFNKRVTLDIIKHYTFHSHFNWYYYNDILRHEIIRHFLN